MNAKPLLQDRFTQLSEMLKALAHPDRLGILYNICREHHQRMTVKNLSITMQLPQPVVSRHLGIMRNCELLNRTTEKGKVYYELNNRNPNSVSIYKCFQEKVC